MEIASVPVLDRCTTKWGGICCLLIRPATNTVGDLEFGTPIVGSDDNGYARTADSGCYRK